VGWYSVRVLLRCVGKGQPKRLPLYEDRIVLVRAGNHRAAQEKARRVINKRERPYKNSLGNVIHWKLNTVFESAELFEDELRNGRVSNGAQVYWRFIRSSNPVKRLKKEGTMNALY